MLLRWSLQLIFISIHKLNSLHSTHMRKWEATAFIIIIIDSDGKAVNVRWSVERILCFVAVILDQPVCIAFYCVDTKQAKQRLVILRTSSKYNMRSYILEYMNHFADTFNPPHWTWNLQTAILKAYIRPSSFCMRQPSFLGASACLCFFFINIKLNLNVLAASDVHGFFMISFLVSCYLNP